MKIIGRHGMRRAWVGLILSVAFAAAAPYGRAWGDDGHRIVGEIAWHHLTPEAKSAVRELLPRGPYGRLNSACTWADRYARSRSSYDWAKPLHYINVPLDASDVEVTGTNCPSGSCVVRAIERFTRRLADPGEEHGNRVDALRWVGHFVGDIHQPLHVAARDGCGGCATRPVFAGADERTIHQIWDTDLIRIYLEPYEPEDGSYVPDLWDELAVDLRGSITEEEWVAWSEVLDPTHWARESLGIAKREDLFRYRSGQSLPSDYADRAHPIVVQRLKQAGVRLAALLNLAFSGDELPF